MKLTIELLCNTAATVVPAAIALAFVDVFLRRNNLNDRPDSRFNASSRNFMPSRNMAIPAIILHMSRDNKKFILS